jgi:hypothetical protein
VWLAGGLLKHWYVYIQEDNGPIRPATCDERQEFLRQSRVFVPEVHPVHQQSAAELTFHAGSTGE